MITMTIAMATAEESSKLFRTRAKRGTLLLYIASAALVLWAGLSTLMHRSMPLFFTTADTLNPDSAQQNDDLQCLSRTQQRLLWNSTIAAELSPPSPHFVQAWDRYAQLHRRCTAGRNFSLDGPFRPQTEYQSEDSNNNSNNNNNGSSDDCLFLLFDEGGCGLGNRLISLISAFAYALVTNRVILIRPSGILPTLLCEVFPDRSSSWILPPTVPNVELAIQNSLGLRDFLDGNPSNQSLVFLNLDHDQSADDEKFFCEETQARLRQQRWLAWHSNQYYVPELFMIPSLWPLLTELFPEPSQVFLHLGRRLVLPNNDVWGIIVREYWSYMAGAKTNLGLQIRLHGYNDTAGFYSEADKQIHRCLLSQNLLPKTDGSEGGLAISNATELASMSRRKGGPDIVNVMVASLQARYAESLQERYSSKATVDRDGHYAGVIRVHSVSHFGHQETGDLQQDLFALAEMWLLGFSEKLVISPFSTFGYVAHGIGQVPPFILRFDQPADYEKSACQAGQTVEPCCLYPKWPACVVDSLRGDRKEWVRTHVRHCQDHEEGIQFVNMKALGRKEGDGEIPLGKEFFLFANHL